MATLYRAASPENEGELQMPHDTRRDPGHVPYVVDNLWAWTRPDPLVDRRFAAFASLSPDQALEYARGDEVQCYRIAFEGSHTICQLVAEGKLFSNGDARYHPDTRNLKAVLLPMLAKAQGLSKYDWSTLPVEEKNGVDLFAPCLSPAEVQETLEDAGLAANHIDTLRESVTYWEDLAVVEDGEPLPDDNGEITFSYPGGYRLRPLADS